MGLPLLLITACIRKPDNNITNRTLFSLDSLINKQEHYLKNRNVTIHRDSRINGKQDKVTFSPDTAFWKNELGVISSADIGKPSLYDRYKIGKSDSAGLSITEYEALDPAVNGTVLMKIGRDRAGNIVQIDVRQQDKSLIFRSGRYMNLGFEHDTISDKYILKHYRVSGFQKMILRKKVVYDLDVSLNWGKPA